jgi:hypothetical protein
VKETSKKTRDLMRKILSEQEVRLMTRRLRKIVEPILGEPSENYGLEIEDAVRFGAVATRLREAREARGMDLKAAARAMRVPHYRLRYIEQRNLSRLRTADLHAYIDFLGLNKWFARWSRANSELAARLVPNSKSKGKKRIS